MLQKLRSLLFNTKKQRWVARARTDCERLGITRLTDKYLHDRDDLTNIKSYKKYLDVDVQLGVNYDRVLSLGLSGPPVRTILDLGSGFGWFAYACQRLGHRVVGVDFHDETNEDCKMFLESNHLFNNTRMVQRIEPFTPLHGLSGYRFDWITASAIQFNRLGRGDFSPDVLESERWGVAEWKFLLTSLQEVATDACRVHLYFNKPQCWTRWYGMDLQSWFESGGAECHGPSVRLKLRDLVS